MSRVAFAGFSLELPEGWNEALEDGTYSDPDEPVPFTFTSSRDVGTLRITLPQFDEDTQPGATIDDVEELAFDWGDARGLGAPLAASSRAEEHAAIASAVYRVGDDFVQVWFVSNGALLLAATYACGWALRYEESSEREALVDSLRFG